MSAAPFLADPSGGAGLEALAANLTAPLAAGAVRTRLPMTDAGFVEVDWEARRPLLMLALREPLEGRTLTARATLGGGEALPELVFAPWSDAGSALPLHCPALAPGSDRVPPFAVTLSLAIDGIELPAAEIGRWIEPLLVEGALGRLLAVFGSESARLRREMREIGAMRALAVARDDALDRIGAELAAPRLDGVLAWNADAKEIVTRPEPETDATYRIRLKLFRRFVAPTPAAVAELLGGPDGPAPGLRVIEPGDPLAIAVRLVSIGPAEPRDRLLERIRTDWLVLPGTGSRNEAVHAARFLPKATQDQAAALRKRLRASFTFPTGAALAPRLADALDRAGRMLTAIDPAAPKLVVARAQDPAGGSRYELGLGVDVTPPAAAAADALTAKLVAGPAASGDATIDGLVAQARATDPPTDGGLDWLWSAAGLRTAHRLPNGDLYLSQLRTAGLTIDGPLAAAPGATIPYRAVFNASGDTGQNAALQAALQAAETAQPAAGPATFTRLDPAEGETRWAAAEDLPIAHPAVDVLAAAGLVSARSAASAVKALGALPDDLLATLALPGPLSVQVRAGDGAAIKPLGELVALLRASGVVSLLPLVTPAGLLLVAGMVGLPTAGINLGERRATGVRWKVVPLGGAAAITAVGGRVMLRAQAPGPVALVALGYVRDGAPDPYEFRCALPEDAPPLDLPRYELLMNALERCYPIGVEINTWDIRQRHVDLEGDGAANPLPPKLARHYRRFRMQRMRGAEEPIPD